MLCPASEEGYPLVNDAGKGSKNYVFWVGLALCTLYQSYRYPLQISSAGTSATYSDTPLILQAGKFALAFPLITVSAIQWVGNSARLTRWPIFLATLFLSGFSILKIMGEHDSQYLDFSFWIFFALVLVLPVDSVTVSAIDKYFYALLIFAFGSTLIEVFLFAAFGRLPALAWEGTYFVRFGGFLDDPNGFAALLFLLMGWSHARFKGWTRFLILAGIVLSLLLAQSWTAMGFLFAILFFYLVIAVSKRAVSAILAICALPLFLTLVIQYIPQLQRGLLWEVLETKRGSIEGHVFPWALWISKWAEWAVLGEWKYNPYESWWASAFVNFGVLWFGVYLILIGALLISLWRASAKSTPETEPIYAGLLLFGFYFAFGSLNLPFPIIFPVNALFFIFFFLVAFGKIVPQNCTTAASGKLLPTHSPVKATHE
jgi:hypothetical protein